MKRYIWHGLCGLELRIYSFSSRICMIFFTDAFMLSKASKMTLTCYKMRWQIIKKATRWNYSLDSLFHPSPVRGGGGSLVLLSLFDHLTPISLLHRSLPPLHPHPFPSLSPSCRESKVQSEAQVPKVILAGRCSKSSAVTGTVVVGPIVRAEGQVGLGYVQQLN